MFDTVKEGRFSTWNSYHNLCLKAVPSEFVQAYCKVNRFCK